MTKLISEVWKFFNLNFIQYLHNKNEKKKKMQPSCNFNFNFEGGGRGGEWMGKRLVD